MRKNIIMIILLLICVLSISANIFQSNKIKEYQSQEKFYTKMFEDGFDELIKSFDLYNESGALSNESAIKNSVSIIGGLSSARGLTSYRENKNLSEMELYLSEFFVLNSDEYINDNIDKIKSQLEIIINNLNDDNAIINFNLQLRKMIP